MKTKIPLRMCVAGTLAAMAMAACGAEPGPSDNAKTVTGDGSVTPLSDFDRSLSELAAETLAEKLNIPIATIEVDTVRAVEWRDSSIGCPQPDQAYAQVITPGHKITLRVDGQFYFVHEANGRAAVCVPSKQTTTDFSADIDLAWGRQAMIARRDLAGRLGVAENLVIIAGAEEMSWPDASLGCPGVEAGDTPIATDGYILELRHGSRTYRYHADLERVFPCPAITEN